MTDLEMYKFVHNLNGNNVSDLRWIEGKLYVWIMPQALRDFTHLLGIEAFDDDILQCYLCYNGDVCIFNFTEVLDYFHIDAENIKASRLF